LTYHISLVYIVLNRKTRAFEILSVVVVIGSLRTCRHDLMS